MKEAYENAKDVYLLNDKWEELLAQKSALDGKAKNRDRYKNRGAQLLREEKERKRVSSVFIFTKKFLTYRHTIIITYIASN